MTADYFKLLLKISIENIIAKESIRKNYQCVCTHTYKVVNAAMANL